MIGAEPGELVRGLAASEQYFLLAHHEQSGKPLVDERVIGRGVAAAALIELAIAGAIDVRNGLVVADDRRTVRAEGASLVRHVLLDLAARELEPVPGAAEYIERHRFHSASPYAEYVLAQVELQGKRPDGKRPVADWLRYLTGPAYAEVRTNLIARTILTERPSRVPGRPSHFEPLSNITSKLHALALMPILRSDPLGEQTAALAALVVATGIDTADPLAWSELHREPAHIERVYKSLSPPVTELIERLRTEVTAAVTTGLL